MSPLTELRQFIFAAENTTHAILLTLDVLSFLVSHKLTLPNPQSESRFRACSCIPPPPPPPRLPFFPLKNTEQSTENTRVVRSALVFLPEGPSGERDPRVPAPLLPLGSGSGRVDSKRPAGWTPGAGRRGLGHRRRCIPPLGVLLLSPRCLFLPEVISCVWFMALSLLLLCD